LSTGNDFHTIKTGEGVIKPHPAQKDNHLQTLVTSPGIESKALKAYRLDTHSLENLIIGSCCLFAVF
jgi:hypothetical protein